jgi:hypothetical protein
MLLAGLDDGQRRDFGTALSDLTHRGFLEHDESMGGRGDRWFILRRHTISGGLRHFKR